MKQFESSLDKRSSVKLSQSCRSAFRDIDKGNKAEAVLLASSDQHERADLLLV